MRALPLFGALGVADGIVSSVSCATLAAFDDEAGGARL
jgi:hypothetical protein